MGEDVVESFLGGDALLAGDGGEVVDDEAQVFGEEVGGEAGGEAVADAGEVVVGIDECGVVADVGNYDIGRRKLGKVEAAVNLLFKVVNALTGLG